VTGFVKEVLAGDAVLDFDPTWITADEADEFLAHLMGLPLRQEAVLLFGRTIPQPRLSLWMGDRDAVYRYSGRTFIPEPWDPLVLSIKERLLRDTRHSYNSVLINLYRDGMDSMGYHSDDEPELGSEPVIASVSLGATRRFILRPKRRKGTTASHELRLTHGSLLVMRGNTQGAWVHGVPKERAVSAPRLNLTFRRVKAPGQG
jgi:alkylated DNA repair dioxygenase AlkB